jgi:DNA-binding transcriptional LysR family regulator
MELRQLRYFVATAHELHFGRAAEKLHISQPALSFDIRKFEDQMGVKLFIRSNKQVMLTSAGQLLLDRAKHLLHEADETEQLMRQSVFGITGRLYVGFVNAMLLRGLPDAVARFTTQNPQVEIILREMNTEEQVRAVANHQIDLGCAHATRYPNEVISEPLLSEPFVCCLPKNHPLASDRRIDLYKLENAPFVCFSRDVSPHYHDYIVALCVGAGFSPWIRHEARLWHTVVTMVGHDMGVALVPGSLRADLSSGARFLPLVNVTGTSDLHMLYRQNQNNSGVAQFASILAHTVHKHAISGHNIT